ncbi:MFS transporter [Paenibacillus chibensis]|uniref:MFS transporter n=1 Tax=Paenibacillus chibensis TaxID=59846 RepID=A0ABU6PNN5_9BACL|nr:MFS transporter [Paenibacillus chibensis]
MLFRNMSFRQLFTARILSVLADSILFFSLLKWIELKSEGDASYTFFYAAYYLPIALLALPVGAWISGKTLQHVMAWSNIVRIVGMIAFIALSSALPLAWVYALLILESIVGLFFMPANQSLLPQVVSEQQRPSANSWLQMGYTIVKIAGQTFTAFMLKQHIPPAQLLVAAVILLIFSWMFIRQIKPLVKLPASKQQSRWNQIKDGIGYIAGHKQVGRLFIFLTAALFIASSVDLILVTFLNEVLGTGVENLSFIGTASLCGMITGAALVPKWYKRMERKWLILPPLFALGCFNITFVTYLQDVVDRENYTRTFSLYHMLSSTAALPGILLTGVLLSVWGVLPTVLVVSCILFLLGILGIFVIPALGKGYIPVDPKLEQAAG